MPLFNYRINDNEELNFNYYDSFNNVEFLVNPQNFNLRWNKYEKFCLSSLKYYNLVNRYIKIYLSNFQIITMK